MQNYNGMLDHDMNKFNQLKRDKQSTPLVSPSQCGMIDGSGPNRLPNHEMM
jgi:hypothetical protein